MHEKLLMEDLWERGSGKGRGRIPHHTRRYSQNSVMQHTTSAAERECVCVCVFVCVELVLGLRQINWTKRPCRASAPANCERSTSRTVPTTPPPLYKKTQEEKLTSSVGLPVDTPQSANVGVPHVERRRRATLLGAVPLTVAVALRKLGPGESKNIRYVTEI
jgi:hypothetical protein